MYMSYLLRICCIIIAGKVVKRRPNTRGLKKKVKSHSPLKLTLKKLINAAKEPAFEVNVFIIYHKLCPEVYFYFFFYIYIIYGISQSPMFILPTDLFCMVWNFVHKFCLLYIWDSPHYYLVYSFLIYVLYASYIFIKKLLCCACTGGITLLSVPYMYLSLSRSNTSSCQFNQKKCLIS